MAVSSGVGLVSGINYTQLITGLTAVDQAEINSVGSRINNLGNQDTALTSLSTLVTALKLSSASFISSSIFKATTATSSNTSIINATGGVGTPPGNYNFTVQQLASASQFVTQGFSSSTSNLGLSGTITLQTGGGNIDEVASLASLNGGAGVARGSVKITDRSGASSTVNLSDAVNIQDVVTAINSSSGANVSASISDNHLVLTDNSAGTGTLSVANTGGTTTAADLGLTGTASGNVLTGTSLTALTSTTSLNSLNDGNGVRTANGLNDFSVTAGGTTFNVQLSNTLKTVNDVVKAINTAGASAGVTAAISSDGTGLTLTASGGGPISVTPLNGSAASDLGLVGSSNSGTLVGDRIATALSGPLLRDLNGGDQLNPGAATPVASTLPTYGTITINGTSVDLTGARSLDDVISGINASNTGVKAAVNSYGDGITLTSTSSTPFTVSDGTGNLASYLKIAGTSTATATGSELDSNSLNLRYISTNTQLSTLNGGSGISKGKIALTDGFGNSQTVDLSLSSINTVGDVLNAINNSGLKLTASINSAGNGIQITQNGGTGSASIAEVSGGSTASSLGILGTFTNGTLNGSFQKSITIAPTDTLANIATKINDAGIGASASIINDGSSGSPYRLSISSKNSGSAARLVFDGSGAGLTATSLVTGQDAVLIYGGSANGTGGLLATSASNTVSGLVPSLTLNLTGVGSTSVAVTGDTSKISTAVQTFVTNYNAVITNIANVTNFDAANNANIGILFGNSTVLQVQQALGNFANTNYSSSIGGSLSGLSSIGITVGTDGTLTLNTDTLNSVLSSDPTDVQKLFTTNIQAVKANANATPPVAASPAVEGIGATLSDLVTRFTDSSTGVLFDATTALESQQTQLTTQQTLLQTLLTSKQSQLQATFTNLESTLSSLQSQGTSISSISSTVSG